MDKIDMENHARKYVTWRVIPTFSCSEIEKRAVISRERILCRDCDVNADVKHF